VLCELGGGADCPFRRSASGEWFWKRRTILNARITGDSASGNRHTARQHSDATGQHRNTTGQHRNTTGQHRNTTGQHRNTTGQHRNTTGQYRNAFGWNRDAANYSWIHIAQRNSEPKGAGLEHAGEPNPGKHYATIHHQSQHAE
jgi:hypothetical protein